MFILSSRLSVPLTQPFRKNEKDCALLNEQIYKENLQEVAQFLASFLCSGERRKKAFNFAQINLTHIQKMQLEKYVNLDVPSNAG